MARYKHYDLNQSKMIPLSYADQVVEGSFEYALNEIVEDHLDLSVFDHRYHNDATGRLAYDPKVLLKILLYGYYRGIISSRRRGLFLRTRECSPLSKEDCRDQRLPREERQETRADR